MDEFQMNSDENVPKINNADVQRMIQKQHDQLKSRQSIEDAKKMAQENIDTVRRTIGEHKRMVWVGGFPRLVDEDNEEGTTKSEQYRLKQTLLRNVNDTMQKQ